MKKEIDMKKEILNTIKEQLQELVIGTRFSPENGEISELLLRIYECLNRQVIAGNILDYHVGTINLDRGSASLVIGIDFSDGSAANLHVDVSNVDLSEPSPMRKDVAPLPVDTDEKVAQAIGENIVATIENAYREYSIDNKRVVQVHAVIDYSLDVIGKMQATVSLVWTTTR